MPLSEDEQRILHEIEQQFYESDPNFAGELGKHSLYVHHLRRMKWAVAMVLVGVVALVVALATETTFVAAFVGFGVMLAAALWFEHNLRKLGRAGMEQLAKSMRTSGMRDFFGSTGQRVRDRFRKED